MIRNKILPEDPDYYIDWDIFENSFPNEALFIFNEFARICKTHNAIYGKTILMNILNNIIPVKFPHLKEMFQQEFPIKRIDAVLGIGLWKAVDLDNNYWRWEIYEGKKYIKE